MKILAGRFKNRSIVVPNEGSFRPTLGRTRAMVFNICQMEIEGASFLDLFAATGAMGFEALSRGAQKAVFIDINPHATNAIKKTALQLQVQEQAKVLCKDVSIGLEYLVKQQETFDLIFLDPPYFKKEAPDLFSKVSEVLSLIDTSDCLRQDGTLFVEDSKSSPIESLPFSHLRLNSKRSCGDAFLWQFKKNS